MSHWTPSGWVICLGGMSKENIWGGKDKYLINIYFGYHCYLTSHCDIQGKFDQSHCKRMKSFNNEIFCATIVGGGKVGGNPVMLTTF